MELVRNLNPRSVPVLLLAGAVLVLGVGAKHGSGGDDEELELEVARIFFEYNSTDNDLGVHIFLDGEDWKKMKIEKPNGQKLFEVKGHGPYANLGMTELFFEGAEPSLDDVPLGQLLASFPEGEYEFEGRTVDGQEIEGEGELSHAIPAAPAVQVQVGANDFLRISWTDVTGPPPGFPNEPIVIAAYQVLIGEELDVTLPASANQLTISPEFVATLGPGTHKFEVLAIEESGNQSITESTFVK
ncbi:MAG: hypothetical protein ACKVXR_05605 [Planctomycetota bacterium]